MEKKPNNDRHSKAKSEKSSFEDEPGTFEDDNIDSNLRKLPVNWLDFETAYQTAETGDEVEAYLNRNTGETLVIFRDADDEEELREKIEDEWDDWIQIERMDSHAAFKVMERFAFSREENRNRKLLAEALSQSRPFRRFKDAVHSDENLRQEWFAFEAAAERAAIEDWFAVHGIQVEWKK